VPETVESAPRAATFQRFVAAHRAELLGRARALCRGHLDADDVVQDALLRAWRGHGSMRDPGRARAWLFSILHNTFIDRVRRQRVAPASRSVEGLELPDVPPPAEPGWHALGGDDLRAAVAELPDDLRDVYRLHALEGRDYVWLADHLGIPKATVGTRLLRARRRLRDLLLAQAPTR